MGKILAAISICVVWAAVTLGPWIVGGLVAWHFIAKYW